MKVKVIIIYLILFCLPAEVLPKDVILTIIHTNDLHLSLPGAPKTSWTGEVTSENPGGWARVAAVIKRENAARANPVLILNSGDTIGHSNDTRIRKEDGAAFVLMKKSGYDVITFGNHEFDFTPDGLAEIILSSKKKGEIPEIVFSSIKKNTILYPVFYSLFDTGHVKKYIVIKKSELKIGIFSVIGLHAGSNIKRLSYLDLQTPVETAAAAVEFFREKENVDIVICLSHSGISDEDNSGREDEILAETVKGIDIIAGGHSHTYLDYPRIINGVIIFQSGEFGKNVGVLDVKYGNGVKVKSFKNVKIDDKIPEDKEIKALIDSL
jgi:2',3'-cyclic-nucleotide 2'-phosphodiesterase (5'-nucleotidase family)